jgi:protein-tyrosine-phosphatase
VSAGSEETPLDPDAVTAMREVGIDISGQESKAVRWRDAFLVVMPG